MKHSSPTSNKFPADKNKSLDLFNIVTIFLSIYVLGALVIESAVKLPPETSKLLNFIDHVICLVFLFDFLRRFIKAENKIHFMKWGWIDLISSIPTIDFLRPGRALRLLRLLRVLRAFKSFKHLYEHVYKNRSQGTFTTVITLAIFVLIFSSIAILQVEVDPASNIKTAEDAIWWAYVTMTTVGYGDKYPVTTEGRMIAVVLMTVGVGLFGTFTGLVSSWFVAARKE